MASGTTLQPPADRFSCFALERHDERVFEPGFALGSLSEQKIRGLVPGSNAALVGVHDGDVVVSAGNLSDIRSDPSLPMTLKLRRGEQAISVSYQPCGAVVEAWHWRKKPAGGAGRCGI